MRQITSLKFAPRDPKERDRVSTSLELMFDLATVVAVGAAARGLAQDISAGHLVSGTIQFAFSFFLAWLAWMNYTWFASGYDDKSPAFRGLSMLVIFGSLTLAGGIQSAETDQRIFLALAGFTIMRVGMIALWLGAANGDPNARPAALRYAAAIAAMQLYWYALVFLVPPHSMLYLPLLMVGVFGELSIPAFAEYGLVANWHHHHIIDRYNMFNFIVLGECFAAVALIISRSGVPNADNFLIGVLCFVIIFSLWGVYFDRRKQLLERKLPTVLVWAYGHYLVFAAGAATAAGMAIILATDRGIPPVSEQLQALAITVPTALYFIALWFVRDRTYGKDAPHWLILGIAAAILAARAFFVYTHSYPAFWI